MIPEVPERDVEHGFFFDDYAYGDGGYPLGSLREREWWGSKRQSDEELRELRKLERRRRRLGGFGFRSAA